MVAITHVQLNDDADARDLFWQNTYKVIDSLEGQPGFLGHKVRRELLGKSGWTMTVWQSQQALQQFKASDAHSTAMKLGMPAVRNARFLRLDVNAEVVPLSWESAESLMKERGRSLY